MRPPFVREGPVAGPCGNCGSIGELRIEHRTLANADLWPYMVCDGCGAERKGELVMEL